MCDGCGTVLTTDPDKSTTIFVDDAEGSWLKELARALRPADATRADYEGLRSLLLEARARGASQTEVASDIEASAPKFAGLTMLLSEKSGTLGVWLTFLITLIMYMQQSESAGPSTPAPAPVTVNLEVQPPPSEDELLRELVKLYPPPELPSSAPHGAGSAP